MDEKKIYLEKAKGSGTDPIFYEIKFSNDKYRELFDKRICELYPAYSEKDIAVRNLFVFVDDNTVFVDLNEYLDLIFLFKTSNAITPLLTQEKLENMLESLLYIKAE